MALKCILLVHYKDNKGRNYRRQVMHLLFFLLTIFVHGATLLLSNNISCCQGQILTLVEYFLLLYRSLLPAPVWYRFFLNKELGSLFSSLMTGLYLTFKLTTVYPKVNFYKYSQLLKFWWLLDFQTGSVFHFQVQNFFTSLKALSHKEVQYGTCATTEQVHTNLSPSLTFHVSVFHIRCLFIILSTSVCFGLQPCIIIIIVTLWNLGASWK